MTLTRIGVSSTVVAAMLVFTPPVWAEKYEIDPTHSFIEFGISHLGFSVLRGRFNDIKGNFSYDKTKPSAATIEVKVATASLDSNHAERDKHLRGKDFFDVEKFPQATFVTTSYSEKDGKGVLKGNLTIRGITKPITVDVKHIGDGKDPWGGYRRGFVGTTKIKRADFGMNYNLGPTAEIVELSFFIEGIRS